MDVIEAGFAIASPMDHKSVQTIAAAVSNCTVASLARCTKGDIDAAWDAVKEAKHPRIHVFLATSDIHMEYKLKMTREQVLERISSMVAYAKSFCDDIEFSAEDASRSDRALFGPVLYQRRGRRCYHAERTRHRGLLHGPRRWRSSSPT